MEKEIWKDIKGYEGLYQVSNLGQIYSYYTNRLLTPSFSEGGYLRIMLYKNKTRYTIHIHKLVATAFLPDRTTFKSMPDEVRSSIDLDNLQVNHKDEDKTNNRVDNLEWCTHKYNAHYGTAIIRRVVKQSISIEQFDLNGNFIKKWDGIAEAGRFFTDTYNAPRRNIQNALKGRGRTACGYIWRYAKK